MTPEQKLALEGLIGRELEVGEIVAIDPLLSDRNDVAIASVLSAGRITTVSTPIGIGTILAVMAPSGGDFLNSLEALSAVDSNVKWALKLIEQSAFDIGHPVTRAQLVAFANAQPALAPAISALLAVAERDDPIHYNAVSDSLNIAEGRMVL